MEKQEDRGCVRMRIIEYHDYKTLMGPCFISFSLPLLIPGVVLTVVGSYGNEHTFARFGAWHISGIVILSFAVILLIAGILLKCCFRPVMSADIEQHLSPNPSVITGSKSLGHDKDGDANEDSNSPRGNGNKVSPLHYPGKHKVFSTHERRHRTHSENHSGANGAISINKKEHSAHNKTSNSDKKSTTKQRSQDRQEIDTMPIKQGKHKRSRAGTDSESDYPDRSHTIKPETYTERGPPPSYDEVNDRHLKSSTSLKTNANNKSDRQAISKAIATPLDGVNTNIHVDTSVVVGGTSQYSNTSGSNHRDQSSDANENSRFLPEKKKKRKKKVKRRRSDRSEPGDEPADEARSVLPELRLRPVLLHDGEPHPHHEHHVHFTPEVEAEGVQQGTEVRHGGTEELGKCEGAAGMDSADDIHEVTKEEKQHNVEIEVEREEECPVC